MSGKGRVVVAVATLLTSAVAISVVDVIAAPVNSPSLEYWQSPDSTAEEAYVQVPMPPGFQVIVAELQGPVFADAEGRTLYTWPQDSLRNGSTGDRQGGVSKCTDEVMRFSSGLMSPYPAGLLMPNVEQRPSCVEVWPPVIASEDAQPVGKWTLVQREDGSNQWAYDGYPLYTSIRDRRPGDVLGGTKLSSGADSSVVRVPAYPPSDVPPGFEVIPIATGRLLVNKDGFSVYTYDGDEPNKSNCYDECLIDWAPVPAPEDPVERGEWSTVERSPGIHQWAYRGKPLYTYRLDPEARSVVGSDVPGWHNAYTQRALPPPEDFTVQDSRVGQVLADSEGKTIYRYNCGDDALDQLACDHPETPQVYRLAICGNGDPKLCQETFPYVIAPDDASSASRLWSVIVIDPNTGNLAEPGQPGALRVWAYRDRPVYTYAGDHEPGDANADAFGEYMGFRNGFKAFWLRDDFKGNAFIQ